MSGSRSRKYAARLVVLAASAGAILGVAGCDDTSSHAASSGPTSSNHPRTPRSAATPTSADDSVTAPPLIPDEKKHLASTASRQGSATLPVAELPAGPVAVMVNCQGKGAMSLSVGDVSSLTVSCEAGAGGTYNVLNFKHAHKNAAVTVKADASIHWSLSVGTVPNS